MTMVPSRNGKHYNNNNNNNIRSGNSDYVIYGDTTTRTSSGAMNQVEVEGSYNCLLGSDFVVRRHIMAESEESSRHNNNNNNTKTNELESEVEVGACGSNSKEEQEGTNNNNNNNNNWLQLSIGTTLTSTKHQERDRTVSTRTGSGLVELDLLPSRRISEQPAAIFPAVVSSTFGGPSSSLNFEHHNETTSSSCCSSSMSMSMHMTSGPITTTTSTTTTFGHQEMMNWAFGPHHQYLSMPIMPSSSSFIIPSNSSSSPSSSHSCYSSLRPPLGSYFPAPFHHHFPPSSSGFDQYDVAAAAGQSSDNSVRVVDPPRRPHSGIWFMLQASQNQMKEPFLPQIPKNYLRIKDGRMTVRLLLKYLVSKLRLESESEIEITCRGQQLLPFLTLQHVRDNIWTQRDNTTQQRALLSDSSTTDHVMVLHYGRST